MKGCKTPEMIVHRAKFLGDVMSKKKPSKDEWWILTKNTGTISYDHKIKALKIFPA